jgi:hypothetical protein
MMEGVLPQRATVQAAGLGKLRIDSWRRALKRPTTGEMETSALAGTVGIGHARVEWIQA